MYIVDYHLGKEQKQGRIATCIYLNVCICIFSYLLGYAQEIFEYAHTRPEASRTEN